MKFAFYLVVILPNQKPDPESEFGIWISDPVKSGIRNVVKTWIRYIPILLYIFKLEDFCCIGKMFGGQYVQDPDHETKLQVHFKSWLGCILSGL